MKSLNGPQSLSKKQLMNWIFRPLNFLEECARKYGDMFNLNKAILWQFLIYPT